MKKSELLNTIATLNSNHKLPKAYESALNEIMTAYSASGRGTPKDEHPAILDESGVVIEVWCNKHLTYENVSEFATSTKGKDGYHNKCRFADYQWKHYLAAIKVVQTNIDEDVRKGEYDNLADLQAQKDTLVSLKDGGYPAQSTLSDEEVVSILPKVKEV